MGSSPERRHPGTGREQAAAGRAHTLGENSGLVCRKVLPVAVMGMAQGGTTCGQGEWEQQWARWRWRCCSNRQL